MNTIVCEFDHFPWLWHFYDYTLITKEGAHSTFLQGVHNLKLWVYSRKNATVTENDQTHKQLCSLNDEIKIRFVHLLKETNQQSESPLSVN